MPIRQPMPITTSFEVVSLRDDALEDVPKKLIDEYEATRDLDILRQPNEELGWPGLDKLPVQPTIALCRPMRVAHQRRLGVGFGADDQWAVFADECERLFNMLDHEGKPIPDAAVSDWWEGKGEARAIRESMRPEIAQLFWAEVANVIVQRGTTGKDSPFMPLGTWDLSRRARAHRRRVETIGKLATSETSASASPSESSGEMPASQKLPTPLTGVS